MNLYDQSIATYRSRLNTLMGLLTKAEAQPSGDALLHAKLAEDMHPLATQVRFVVNIPGEAIQRLGASSFTSKEDDPATIAQAKEHISQTTAFLDGFSKDDLPAPDSCIEFAIGDGAFNFAMSAEEYVREFSIPNFYFHLTTAYAILRKEGLDIGKADFIPHMAHYFKVPS